MERLEISERVSFSSLKNFIFRGPGECELVWPSQWRESIERSHKDFMTRLERREPIYGVTTGFGDSSFRRVDLEKSHLLQENLIRYLSCGTGPCLRRPVRRAIGLFRTMSLGRALSGVSWELIERMIALVESDAIPLIPAEGSLGASGDLIPLAYLASAIQGWGEVETPSGMMEASKMGNPYRLKPKEGLALVNGTSAMVAQSYVNIVEAEMLAELCCLETSWLCLALSGRDEPFSPLVNEIAKRFQGQGEVARRIKAILNDESYSVPRLTPEDLAKETAIQDRYSLRCAPQILGPVWDTITLVKSWIEIEINGVSDNPLVDPEDGSLHSGGNFYGGYLSHGMDYLKISLAHMADLVDRQITLLIDEKSNRGLPPNLANWPGLPREERTLHHGLKGLHQAISAITSEVMARSLSVGIFSRSTESHNQDKVSLGMGAAVSCETQIDALFRIHAMALICLAQALDLKGIRLQGNYSKTWYEKVRRLVPFIERDQALDKKIMALSKALREFVEESVGESA
jgi:histidine ammonia-lyase